MTLAINDTLFQSLPAIYRREEKPGFTYRLLGLFADVLEGVEDEVYGLHRQLNALRADPEFLPWLASWVSLVLDETWAVSKRRELIRRIVQLYTTRGTVEGLREFVEIFTGIKPDIIEEFSAGWRVGVASTVGEDTRIYGSVGQNAHRFSVRVNSFEDLTAQQKDRLRERILTEKPSHTQLVHIEFFARFWQIGVRSTAGVDARVGG